MLDGIDALLALEKYSTISEAAVRMRLTQSAVSKRIQSLEKELKMKLIEPDGRRVKLTSSAYKFLNKARPLIIELKNLANDKDKTNLSNFSLGLSDSIAGSFGPLIVNKTMKENKNLKLDLHVHRSLMLIENIMLGKYQMGICTEYESRKDIVSFHLYDEPLVVISCELSSKFQKNLPLITIEENSATWKAISPIIKNEYQHLFAATHFVFVESFLASFQMAKVGLGNALIPLGMAKELGLKKNQYRILKLKRPVSLVTRKTISQLEFFEPFKNQIKKNIQSYFENN
jgi:DNA-binding transcriptional LysR family regulator